MVVVIRCLCGFCLDAFAFCCLTDIDALWFGLLVVWLSLDVWVEVLGLVALVFLALLGLSVFCGWV